MRITRSMLAALVLMLLTMPAAALAQSDAKVTGQVRYLEKILLPTGSRVIVQLQDVSRADAPASTIAEQTIDTMGKGPPYTFELTYDAGKIDSRSTYAVRAEIRNGDTLLFSSTERYAVITQGNPVSGVQVLVKPVGSNPVASLPKELLDRDWKLVSLQRGAQDIQQPASAGVSIRFTADGRVSGSGGCNGFGGTYTAGANRSLAISNIIATLKACSPDAITTFEQEYFKALQSVASYTFDGQSGLQLIYNNGQRLAELEAN